MLEGLLRGLPGFSAGILLFYHRRQAWIFAYSAALSLAVLLARKGQSVDLMLDVVAIMALFPALLRLLAAIRPRILEEKCRPSSAIFPMRFICCMCPWV
ncbi:hypothetical protein [Janthinobacterium sp. 1_2014MBL_MicDiv]|uniref:hypothetical protein n=1 Tax=Janthinobacterium sp. 1_2014MBL_MicDiv TaxID=1644131 RepID=UPI0008F51304|nr:hypothetical protein [Janthinobacterium sp. 1_2014MBL_MicDiv]APA68265.1 hypothetical protein YQ44_11005 [Janthinobacterium sp. 1_2014MBL_MicDiv]